MAEQNEQVLDLVRRELEHEPELGSVELYRRAQEADSSIREITRQQFHGRYVLPIKRERAAARGGDRPQDGGKGSSRRQKAPAGSTGGRSRSRSGRNAQGAQTPAPAGGEATSEHGAMDRDRIRGVFLRFAREFAEAESRAEIVQVLSRVDEYVDQIVAETR